VLKPARWIIALCITLWHLFRTYYMSVHTPGPPALLFPLMWRHEVPTTRRHIPEDSTLNWYSIEKELTYQPIRNVFRASLCQGSRLFVTFMSLRLCGNNWCIKTAQAIVPLLSLPTLAIGKLGKRFSLVNHPVSNSLYNVKWLDDS
jgi:hypothetical protein